MAKFKVRRYVDAYAVYEAEVEAVTADEASTKACDNEGDYEWVGPDIQTFDARSFVSLGEDGGEILSTSVGDL